jgi:diacylglycerol O-acyltransferase / wax synthase
VCAWSHKERCDTIPAMPDRLTGLDSSFLHLEQHGAHMHVAACMTFEGEPPSHDELVEMIESRLHLVPRYRQRLAFVPLSQGRPVWVDDPHFNVRYHVRHTALPAPGGDEELRRLCGRLFSQRIDRTKPLWELWLAEGYRRDHFAVISKTHHALVDGISGVDLVSVLFDSAPDPMPVPEPETPWVPRPLPGGAQLLADAMLERATVPQEMARGIRHALRAPRQIAEGARDALVGVGALAFAGLNPAPASPLNRPIGPHRRFAWVDAELDDFRKVKSTLGGTVNDVVLTAVAGALGRYLRRQGHSTDGLTLKAMVPVSVRADLERGALGNRVAAMMAPLPVGVEDPEERLAIVSEAMADIKRSGQAMGAQALTELTGFAPPTVMSQAARLVARQRFFNLVVTNVPGPQHPLYLLGRRLEAIYPMVPLARNQALGIALMSYAGRLDFGLNGDFDAMEDLDLLADDLRESIGELTAAAAGARAPSQG